MLTQILFTVLASSLLGLLLFKLYEFFYWRNKLSNFPSALPLPLIGNLYNPEAIQFMGFLIKMRKKLGKFFLYWGGNKPFLIVADPSAARQVLSDGKSFIKGYEYRTVFSLVFGDGLVTSDEEKHRRDRKYFSKYFIRSNIEDYVDVMNDVALQIVNENMTEDAGKVIDAQNYFHVLTLRVFGRFALDHDFSKNAEEEQWIVEYTSKGSWAIGRTIGLGLPLWNIFPQVKLMRDYRVKFGAILMKILLARKQKIEDGEDVPQDVLTEMLKQDLDMTDMMDHLITMVAAGHDTTAFFACYMSYLLAHNPEQQERLRDEVFSVMGDREAVTKEDLGNFPFMRRVMQETLRLYPTIPQVTREATKDVKLKDSDTVIPAGTAVLVPMFLMHRDGDVWDNPKDFNPDRFEGIEHTSAKMGFLPFGYGGRTCIGNTLAIIEATVMFVQLLRRYRIEKVEGFKPKITSGISLTSENGIQVVFHPLDA